MTTTKRQLVEKINLAGLARVAHARILSKIEHRLSECDTAAQQLDFLHELEAVCDEARA